MIGKLLKMQMLEDDDELAYAAPTEKDEDAARLEADGRPVWMRILCTDLQEWVKMLPKVFR
jgi:dynein heavy chain 1